jgi:hypothetical protein
MKELGKLLQAAREENWKLVDSIIPKIKSEEGYYRWAYDVGISYDDGNVRDLAVSIIEKSEIPAQAFSRMRSKLNQLMLGDSNKYVQFRAAFALANHGAGDYKKAVLDKLNEATEDDDIKEIAIAYLRRVKRVTV